MKHMLQMTVSRPPRLNYRGLQLSLMQTFVVLVCSASTVEAVLSVLSGGTVLETATTSVLKYFGPQADEVNAPAVFFSSNALCDLDTSADVEGKVVIGTSMGSSLIRCNFMTMYRRLNAAGAAGFVKLVPRYPPGLFTTFDHDAWDTAETQGMQMTMVEVFDGDIKYRFKNAGNISDFRVSISPDHNTEWEDVYTSTVWLVAMRILAPLCCLFFVSWAGFDEARACWANLLASYVTNEDRATTELKAAAFVVCCASSACSFLAAILLIFGSWAAKMAPSYIHRQFSIWFLGTSTSITLITCMVMREKLKSSTARYLPMNVLSEAYRGALALSVLGPVGDFILGYMSAGGNENFWGYDAVVALCFLVNISIGAAFSYYAFVLGGPLLKYMYMRGSTGSALPPVAPHVSAVVSALLMNVVFIMLNTLSTAMYVPLKAATHAPPVLIQSSVAFFLLSRIGQFYWLVRSHCHDKVYYL